MSYNKGVNILGALARIRECSPIYAFIIAVLIVHFLRKEKYKVKDIDVKEFSPSPLTNFI